MTSLKIIPKTTTAGKNSELFVALLHDVDEDPGLIH